jgi:hypothetical protein
MGVAFEHHRGVNSSSLYALRAGKEFSGMKMMDRTDFVSAVWATGFGA